MAKKTITHNTPEPAPAQAATVEALRNQRDELVLRAEIAAMNSVGISEESLSRSANYVNISEWLTDNQGTEYYGYYGLTDTRKDGHNRPFIETEQDLIEMRGFARVMVGTNPYLRGVLENLTNYVIGTGFVYTATARKSRAVNPHLVALVQDCIDDFEEQNLWSGNAEREIFSRGSRDGEVPIRIHHMGGGRCKIRIIEPEVIREPRAQVRALEEYLARQYPDLMNWYGDPSCWTFGVHTPERDVEDHLGYFAEWKPTGSDYEYILARDLVFIRNNVDRNVKRGISDFYPVEQLSDRAMKLCRNIATGATVQAGIAFIEQMEENVSAQQGSDMAALVAEWQKRRTSTNGGGIQSDNYSSIGEGTKLTIPKGRTYSPGPMGQSSAPVYLDVLQGVLRAIGTRWNMPEYMVSGDASNGNYASSVEAGTPFVKACEAAQFRYKGYFRSIFWKVLEHNFKAGKFSPYVNSYGELRRLIKLDIAVPDVEVRDPVAETQRRQILFEKGGLSMQTWMTEEGYDAKQEKENQQTADTPQPTATATVTATAAPGAGHVAESQDAATISKIYDAIWNQD
jgi:hypothetical protein